MFRNNFFHKASWERARHPCYFKKRNVGLQNLMFRKCYFQTQEKSLTFSSKLKQSLMSLTTNSCAGSDGNCLLLLSSVNKDVALGSLKRYLSILLSVFKFNLSFPSKYVRSAKSCVILLMTASQILCSLYPFFNPLLIGNIKLKKVSLSFCPGVPILPFVSSSLYLIKVCNFSSLQLGLMEIQFLLENVQSYSRNYFYSTSPPYQMHLETDYLLVFCNEI